MQNPALEVGVSPAELALPVDSLSHPAAPQHGLVPPRPLSKIMLVQFRNGEAISKHPELQNFLDQGWTIRSAVPRIVESEGTKLLVVMSRADPTPRLTRIK